MTWFHRTGTLSCTIPYRIVDPSGEISGLNVENQLLHNIPIAPERLTIWTNTLNMLMFVKWSDKLKLFVSDSSEMSIFS